MNATPGTPDSEGWNPPPPPPSAQMGRGILVVYGVLGGLFLLIVTGIFGTWVHNHISVANTAANVSVDLLSVPLLGWIIAFVVAFRRRRIRVSVATASMTVFLVLECTWTVVGMQILGFNPFIGVYGYGPAAVEALVFALVSLALMVVLLPAVMSPRWLSPRSTRPPWA